MEVWPSNPTAGPHPSEDFSMSYLLPRLHPISLQVKVHREEATPVMQDHRIATEEHLAHIHHHSTVTRPDRRPRRGPEIHAAVGAPGSSVDNPPEPKFATHPKCHLKRRDKRLRPVRSPLPLRPDRRKQRLLPTDPLEGFCVEIHHPPRQREVLHGKATICHGDRDPKTVPLS